jgi:hypothetical protein
MDHDRHRHGGSREEHPRVQEDHDPAKGNRKPVSS